MENFPNEILYKIFSRISFEERLECLLVCRYWYNVLVEHFLLYDVIIYNEYKFKEFVDIIQNIPSRGNQVEILNIEFMPNSCFDYQKLCNILPNLRKVQFMDNAQWGSKENFWGEPFELQTIDSKLEEIKDFANCGLTRQLMVSNSCTRLTSLELELTWIQNPREEIFTYFKNTPALKNLRLDYVHIGIEDCEMLHKNVAALSNFHLKHLTLNGGELLFNIVPATSVKTFLMNVYEVDDLINISNWYRYLAKKYTNLITFESKDSCICRANPNQTIEVYRDGLLPIYKNIGGQLDNFNANNIPTEVDIFNKLDKCGVRFERFNFENNQYRPIFTQLAESNLSNYAKHITLVSTIIYSPILLQNFTSLISVHIFTKNDEYLPITDLTDYFNSFPPTLISFRAYFGEVKISELPAHSNNIEEFQLCCNTIYPKLAEAISSHFPKLNCLDLQGLVTENINIDLSNNHFSSIKIAARFYSNLSNGFSVTSAKSPQPQYYIGNPSSYSNIVPATAEDLENRVNISIKYVTADETSFSTSSMLSRVI